MQNSKNPPSLFVHEWLAIVTLLSFLTVLTILAIVRDEGVLPKSTKPPHYIVDQRIEVFVEGAVEKPVRIVVTRGTLLEEVLKQAQLLPDADPERLKLQTKVRRGQHIRVPFKKATKRKKQVQE